MDNCDGFSLIYGSSRCVALRCGHLLADTIMCTNAFVCNIFFPAPPLPLFLSNQICVRDVNKTRSFTLEQHTTMVTDYNGEHTLTATARPLALVVCEETPSSWLKPMDLMQGLLGDYPYETRSCPVPR